MASPTSQRLGTHGGDVTSVSFSPDGTKLASGGTDRRVRIWDLSAETTMGQQLGTDATRHSGHVTSVSYSPDGTKFATGSKDDTVRIWDIATEQYSTLTGHNDDVLSVSFSPDGTKLASGSEDDTIRLTDITQPTLHLDLQAEGGNLITYPQPLLLTLSLTQNLPITGVNIASANITSPSGNEISLGLNDAGENGDAVEGDGIYSVLWNGYTEDGVYNIRVEVDGVGVSPSYTTEGLLTAKLPSGTIPSTGTPGTIEVSTGLQVIVQGVETDDHEGTLDALSNAVVTPVADCTEVMANNREVAGNIEAAADVDCFRITEIATNIASGEDLVIRLTDLIADVESDYNPTFTLYQSDGSTEVATWSSATHTLQSGGLILKIAAADVDRDPNSTYIVAVKDEEVTVSGWSYKVSAGIEIVSDAEAYKIPPLNSIELSLPSTPITEVASGTEVTVTATLDSAPDANLVVTLSVGGAGITSDDYTLPSTLLTIRAEQTTGTTTLTINDDNIVEGEEILEIYISRVHQFEVSNDTPSSNAARLTITDNDGMATVSLTVDSPTDASACTDSTPNCTKEGGAVSITATSDKMISQDVVVTLALMDSNTNGTEGTADYEALSSQMLTIPAGSTTSNAVTLTTLDDTLIEGDETLVVSIMDVSPDLGGSVTAITTPVPVTIEDTDAADVRVSVAALGSESDCTTVSVTTDTMVSITEGGGVCIIASLESDSDTALSLAEAVTVMLTEDAPVTTDAADFTTPLNPTPTITLPRMEEGVAATFLLMTTDNTIIEGPETLTLTPSIVEDALVSLVGGQGDITVTIEDDDTAAVILSLAYPVDATAQAPCTDLQSLEVSRIEEGGTLCITASLSEFSAENLTLVEDVTVTLTTEGSTATTTTDYRLTPSGPFSLSTATPEAMQQILELSIVEDDVVEGTELLGVYISDIMPALVTNGTPVGSPLTVNIEDASSEVSLSIASADLMLSEAGSAMITAMLSDVVAADVEVTLAVTAGSTAVPADYTLPSITIAANATSATGTLSITDDDIVEGSETIGVYIERLDASMESVLNRTPQSDAITVTITDTDTATVTLDVSPDPVVEGESTTITATLSVLVDAAVTVSLATTLGSGDGSAGSGDLTTTLADIMIPENTMSASTMLSTTQDTDKEGDETFGVYIDTITATGFESRVSNGTPVGSQLTVTIQDDDVPSLSLSIDQSESTVSEGGDVTVTATLSEAVSSEVVVTLGATTGSTAEATDYTLPSITLAANATSATGTLEITMDDIVEGNETIEVYIDDITSTEMVLNGTLEGSAIVVTIEDDDVAEVMLRLSSSGGMRTVTARLDKVFEVEVVVTLTTSDGTTLSTITIPAGMRSGSTEGIEITDDVEVYIGGITESGSGQSLSSLVSHDHDNQQGGRPFTVTMYTSSGGGGSIDVYVLMLLGWLLGFRLLRRRVRI